MKARLLRLGDRALDRVLRLPRPVTEFTVHRGVKVPMRDGVELIADHFAPTTTTPAGTLLMRTPYGRGIIAATLYGRLYAARGYHVVLQSVRGTFGSGDTFQPMTQEVTDGADTAAWLCQQPWFTGSFATIGTSYGGMVQWAMLQEPPAGLAAAVIIVGPHDVGGWSWGTGAFALSDLLSWCNQVAYQENMGTVGKLMNMRRNARLLESALAGLPLGEAGRALLGEGSPWYESWLEHPDPHDPFWASTRFDKALDTARVPVLLIAGWQDPFLGQNLEQYRRLRDRDVDVALTVGPWNHGLMLSRATGDISREALQWLDIHLAHTGDAPMRSRVRIFINNDGWVELPDWPPATTPQTLYLLPGSVLADQPAHGDAATSQFVYEPSSPTPAIGGQLMSPSGGYRDDSRLAARDDVLAFTGSPLASDVYLVGNPVVELWHSSDNPHVDVFVRVSEVDTRGRSRNVSDGYRRLTATAEPSMVRIELDAVAHRFPAGSRIRLLVTGGAHPRFSRNPGTGEPPLTAQRLVAATHTLHHERSRLILPTTAGRPSPDSAANHGGDLQ